MKILLLLCVVVTVLGMEETSFTGYHRGAGIPAAKIIYKAETTVSPVESKIRSPQSLAARSFLVGVVVNVAASYSVCASSMLTNTRAITAAHCWWDGKDHAQKFTLVFGSEFLFVGGLRVETSNVTMHPYFEPETNLHDLAMIVFNYVWYTDYIQPIALPFGHEKNNFSDYWVQVSGYGKVSPGKIGYEENHAQKDETTWVVECGSNNHQHIRDTLLCVANDQPRTNCISSSGGPLTTVINNNNQRFLIGVLSISDHHCKLNDPSEFIRVTSYLPWIRLKLQ